MVVRKAATRAVVSVAAVALLSAIAACGSSSGGQGGASPASSAGGGAAGNKASAPGISANEIKIGYIGSQTGALASSQVGAIDGLEARIALQNAQGGVNGRKISVSVEDDQSVTSNELPVAQKLVQQKNSFAVLEESVLFSGAYRYLQQQQVPVLTGDAIDGQEWGDPSISNMFQATGATSAAAPPALAIMKVLKAQGASKLALLAYGSNPSSFTLAESLQKAAESEGVKVVYFNRTLQVPATGLSTVAVQIQKSGADSLIDPLVPADNDSVRLALKNQGVNLRVPVTLKYGQEIIDDRYLAGGVTSVVQYAPVELKTAATMAFDDALHKYSSFKGVPDVGAYYGWAAADLFIHGLQLAGRNPTREGYITALHSETHYTAGGLQQPVDLAQNKQGTYVNLTAGNCVYGVSLANGKFTPVKGNPFCQ